MEMKYINIDDDHHYIRNFYNISPGNSFNFNPSRQYKQESLDLRKHQFVVNIKHLKEQTQINCFRYIFT